MQIPVKTASGEYEVIIEPGALSRAGEYLSLCRRVLIVTDDGVPPKYSETLARFCREPVIITLNQGEQTKRMESYIRLLTVLTESGFTRSDCVAAVGGGVVGDLAGFAAATYMRGIEFYNLPTTVLSQVDSSIGGKTAIDFGGYKNIVGAFYQPSAVIADTDTLKTLPARQVSNGLAESVKMALTHDERLFSIFESGDIEKNLSVIIERSIDIKRAVVAEDEREGGLRRVLNFGHTLAHAIESVCGMKGYYHGECVALGMLPMCAPKVRKRLVSVLEKLALPTKLDFNVEALLSACAHDKKLSGKDITIVYVPEIGRFEFKTLPFSEFCDTVRRGLL